MEHEDLVRSLLELNKAEQQAYKHFLDTGALADYTLLTPAGQRYPSKELLTKDHFPEGKQIVLEKVLRYVQIPEHSHEFMECSYVVCGQVEHLVSGFSHRQAPGTFSVIPPGTAHELLAEPNALCFTVKIRNEVFASLRSPDIPAFSVPIAFFCREDAFVRHFLLSMWEQQERNAVYADEMIGTLLDGLLMYLLQNFQDEKAYLGINSLTDSKMAQIAVYMFENYRTVTLHSLAKEFHFNESYLSHLIRRETGITFTEALRAFRLARARELLLATSNRLDDICEEIGYHDSTQFIKHFKARYGVTPARFRRHSKE